MKNLLKIVIIFYSFCNFLCAQPKILHVTFHKGCVREIDQICQKLQLDVSHFLILDVPKENFDGKTLGNARYNLSREMALEIYKRNECYFNSFDVVITSDTTPLARIFLENHFSKPLIIWVCNRFDYADQATNYNKFPDPGYFQLIKESVEFPHVRYISYTDFEHIYAKDYKKINFGYEVIQPSGLYPKQAHFQSFIPPSIKREETFFIPRYHNDTKLINLEKKLKEVGINAYCGKYNGPDDLIGFRGIIHIPYAWSNFALFQNIQNGLIHFIPSKKFFSKCSKLNRFFFSPPFDIKYLQYSEWYNDKNSPLFVFFDSFYDLKKKIQTLNFQHKQKQIQTFADNHQKHILSKWKKIFTELEVLQSD